MAEAAYTVASDSENTGEEKSSSSPSLPEIALGIDIGTSQCSIAVWNGSQVHILRNTRNQKLIKSFVTFKDEVPAGGVSNQLAHEQEMLTGAAIFNMKRLVGRVDTDPVVHASKNLPFLVQTLDIGVRPFIAALVNNAWRSTTPEEVLAIFLVELRLMAEAQLKRPVRNVVLTVPVSFSRFQLTRFERACAMAGLHVLRLMPEPTAIALLYAQQQQMTTHDNMGSGSERLAVIFNMGAGYCDVAVTATAGGVSQIKALAGSPIGGEDILQNTIRHIAPPNEEASGLLRVAAQDAIHRLTDQENVQIEVDLGNGNKISKVLDRLEFEEVNQKVFEECERLVVQCLRDARVNGGDIDDLIMVGGCSYIPKVRTIIKNVCKKDEIYKGVNPLEAAVRGAALEGAVTSGIHDPFGSLDLLTIQATPLAVGVRANGNKFIPVIPRNTMVPARKDLFFTTVQDNQKEALIIIYEGEGETVEENHLLGYFKLVGIPPAPKGVPEINVCMDIDASNALRVFAAVLMPGSSSPVVPVIEVRMPTVDDGHGWCAQALNVKYGATLDLITLQRKM
ncbi:Heat shock 70 kDa protein 8 [Arabidopsis thaliana]|jgi:heat shock protein 4|uniref:Heat shock 70 kDa protein 8 n=4 Tax=Arabidopsis TaxID=3701 RepID=HSP7H_ARATH|nr:heat-shock protein 70T-2 [Arabidopsis thaliana]NP_850183.1 heat-shock protein 70T-2 [Arabidopsis thaliana]Q9SKY8.1 RecName: Full=Heat shock 70 kDa protein 8; AltName: Full=Heat shock protein 70-8; Short=AtHsp70-8; AltName: Full=Heat-shock protein 70T-2 [Arabidopsis thaliana]KAG7638183.1 Heat shock protein 70kD peptide-binding domain superfamily [Arabidopsis thaliana x Arabidopsis arenosa]KAG7642798.1 Heat shock protein 70kD peptide-binding domain superfamily [Arabidopsis suecica]AAD15393.1 |eukprot:NP_180771.1 heat-shock protein 70T-2 [Arabidopsis thaliana]